MILVTNLARMNSMISDAHSPYPIPVKNENNPRMTANPT